jgi:MtN3 and saliva related transmembrane protein
LGYAAGFLTTFSAAPQLLHAYRVKDLRSIDLKFQLMLLSGLALWTIYGIAIQVLPVIIFNLIGFSLWVPVFLMKLRETTKT